MKMETKTRCIRLGSWRGVFVFLVLLLLAANPACARRSRSKGARTGGQGELNSTGAEDDTGQEDRRRGKFRKENKILSSDVFLPFCTSTYRYVQGCQREKTIRTKGEGSEGHFRLLSLPLLIWPTILYKKVTSFLWTHFVKVGHAR